MAHLLCMFTASSFCFRYKWTKNLDLYIHIWSEHWTQTSTEPTERYVKSKLLLLLLNGKFQCPSSKQFTRKWLFIYEKLCPDATINIQRAITTLTLLPFCFQMNNSNTPNKQLALFSLLFFCVCWLSSFVVVIIVVEVSLVKYGMRLRYSTHTHTQKHNYQTRTV